MGQDVDTAVCRILKNLIIMTTAEFKFFESMPKLLKDVVDELKEANKRLKEVEEKLSTSFSDNLTV